MITDVIKVVEFVRGEEEGTDVSENDARFVVEKFHQFASDGKLEKLFKLSDHGLIQDCRKFLSINSVSANQTITIEKANFVGVKLLRLTSNQATKTWKLF